ncbi:MAG: hypothetical protein ACE5FG_03870 [Myxococcota bacterium]
MSVPSEVIEASRTGRPIRIHTRDGEVLVARVLTYDRREVVCAVLTSSRPERYGDCDATGYAFPHEGIERVQLLREPRDA